MSLGHYLAAFKLFLFFSSHKTQDSIHHKGLDELVYTKCKITENATNIDSIIQDYYLTDFKLSQITSNAIWALLPKGPPA